MEQNFAEMFGKPYVAYFSMEIGIDPKIPTYSGGLGVLAGDMLRSCADLNVPVMGITLLYKKGYFKQKIIDGSQVEEEFHWNPAEFMEQLPVRIKIKIDGREVAVEAWFYKIEGEIGEVPIIFLSTDLPENSEYDRAITDKLYANDDYYRLCQEIVLGIGGARMIAALGLTPGKYHMNEGHSSLLTLELCRKSTARDVMKDVRKRCVFTTHTPVPAGHDQFPRDVAEKALGEMISDKFREEVFYEGKLNMTYLGLKFSKYVNGVAKKHGEVSRHMFPGYSIDSITNGVHPGFWASEPFRRLYNKYIPGWQRDPFLLRYALSIPREEFWKAHKEAKKTLINYINSKYGLDFDPSVFTLGFARRATAYKRGDLLFSDINRLKDIASRQEIQIVYGGKAHPRDTEGKCIIKRITDQMKEVHGAIKCVYLEDYDIEIAKMLVAGVDVWLNTPQKPREASGTSGMKAAHNGVPQFSVLDGWWIEGHIENVTGWSIGPHPNQGQETNSTCDLEDLYVKLEYIILPMYYNGLEQWINIMRHTIAINASFFNTHRMAQQYVLNAYFR
ncbi:MAG: alpha-glucan family phosphorylase [Candidatus Aenigmarchaeota archaeon]|nr:alpha-glucan family phosphorylase [Candidatus Aenigmarchaeota archaeon]